MAPDDGTVGVYVHVPFCERVCPYCDFPVVAARRLGAEEEERTARALCAELRRRRPVFAGRRLASVYLGGGTPSLLAPATLAAVLEAVHGAFPDPASPAGPEITLEVNPSTLERGRLPGFRDAGVGRLSIGVQSFDDLVLRRLGRAHRADEARRTLAAARAAGFDNLSLDLIVGGPDSTLQRVESDLEEVVRHEPEHVSVYELTVEAGTPFAEAARRGRLRRPDEETATRMLELAEERLEAAGLRRYEISSYARPGRESRHNLRYWQRLPVLGVGLGAWSTDPPGPDAPHGVRRANTRELGPWLERAEAGLPAEATSERLEPATARGEAVFLALRRRQGLRAASFCAEFGAPPRHFFGPAIAELRDAGLLSESAEGDLALTARGRLLSDSVFERFV